MEDELVIRQIYLLVAK